MQPVLSDEITKSELEKSDVPMRPSTSLIQS